MDADKILRKPYVLLRGKHYGPRVDGKSKEYKTGDTVLLTANQAVNFADKFKSQAVVDMEIAALHAAAKDKTEAVETKEAEDKKVRDELAKVNADELAKVNAELAEANAENAANAKKAKDAEEAKATETAKVVTATPTPTPPVKSDKK